MAWTAGVDRAAGYVVTAANWNSYLGATGSMEYLYAALDTVARAQEDGGAVIGPRAAINFIPGTNVTVGVVDNGVDDRIDVTISSTGGATPTQAESSGIINVVTSAVQNVKGAYEEAITSTGFAVTYIMLSLQGVTSENFLYDLSTGAETFEVVLIPNIGITYLGGGMYNAFFTIPMTVAETTRIALRAANASTNNARTLQCSVTVLG